MSKIKKSILIVSIVIILIIISMIIVKIIFYNKEEISTDNGYKESEDLHVRELESDWKHVNNKNEYYAIKRIIDKYLSYIKQANGFIGEIKYEDAEIKDEGIKSIYNVLGEEYIEQFKVDDASLKNEVSSFNVYLADILNMYVSEITSSIDIYIVEALVDNKDFNLIIKTDSSNMTFAIYPQEYIEKNNYNINMSSKDININDKEILKNDYNIFKYINISDQYMAMQYINNYTDKMLNNPEKAYEYLDQEYREKRFGDIEEFKNFISENKSELDNLQTQSFTKNKYKDYTEFVCKDQYGNIYVFKDKSIMNYTVELDDYTIENEEYVKEYNALDDEYKVANNINKWVKMINHRDYKTAYSVLDEAFKNNYFKTEEDFEKYMRRYFPSHYEIEFKDFSKESGSIYTMDVLFKDMTNKENEFKRTFIMKLKDSTDFVMSMEIFTK